MNWMRPVSTTAMAFSASGLVRTNHCVEISGSTTVLQRSQLADGERVRLDLLQQAKAFQILDHAAARFEAVEAGVGTGCGGHAGRPRRSP